MYTVTVAKECSCFTKSEYKAVTSYDTQREAYNYAHTLAELMNDDFCTTHKFIAQMAGEGEFIIGVIDNPNAGCGTGSSDDSCSTGTCGC